MNEAQIKAAIRNSTTLQLGEGFRESPLNGTRVKILRQSKRTGNLTITLLEDAGAYVTGTELHVMPFNLEPNQPRQNEREEDYLACAQYILSRLRSYVENGRIQREKVARKITEGGFEVLADVYRWGNGLREDLLAAQASRMLDATSVFDLVTTLDAFAEEMSDMLRRNQFGATSTSMLTNAVALERAVVAREILEFCERNSRELKARRAMIEVL